MEVADDGFCNFESKTKFFKQSLQCANFVNIIDPDTGGMFDSILFDNSKLIMFNDWKVSFLRKKYLSIEPNT
jgi:hypothetical protein